MTRTAKSVAAATVLAVLAAAPTARAEAPKPVQAGAPSDAQIESVVRKWVDEHPELIIQSLNKYVAQENAKKAEARNAQALGATQEIFDTKGQPAIGNPSGKVTVVYVLDGACGYCRVMTPVMQELVERNPDLRIVHRWVNFLGSPSEYAARAALVTWKRYPAKYPAFYHDLMSQKGQLSNALVDQVLAGALGEDLALQVRSEVSTGAKEVEGTLADNVNLAKRAAVEGTPTLFVDGIGAAGILRGAQRQPEMQKAIEQARTALANR